MKILTRPHKGHHWDVVESRAYTDEGHLQKLLDESPEVVSLEEIRPGAGHPVGRVVAARGSRKVFRNVRVVY